MHDTSCSRDCSKQWKLCRQTHERPVSIDPVWVSGLTALHTVPRSPKPSPRRDGEEVLLLTLVSGPCFV